MLTSLYQSERKLYDWIFPCFLDPGCSVIGFVYSIPTVIQQQQKQRVVKKEDPLDCCQQISSETCSEHPTLLKKKYLLIGREVMRDDKSHDLLPTTLEDFVLDDSYPPLSEGSFNLTIVVRPDRSDDERYQPFHLEREATLHQALSFGPIRLFGSAFETQCQSVSFLPSPGSVSLTSHQQLHKLLSN